MTDPKTPTGLRARWVSRSAAKAQIDEAAAAQLADDEARIDRPRAKRLSLGDVGGAFWSHPSPWILSAMLVTTITARLVVGGWASGDLVVVAIMIATFPLVEWLIHVFILHLRPIVIGPITIDPLLAREHRAHHVEPRDLPLVFIPWPTYVWLVPILAAVGLLGFPRTGLGLTYLVTLSAFGFVYEWTHYLIHSDYKPRSGLYRAVWRNHRLHHYKNENYWFTVTTSGTADRLLGTFPDAGDVATSPTARDLASR